jgi:hypothetical protein
MDAQAGVGVSESTAWTYRIAVKCWLRIALWFL